MSEFVNARAAREWREERDRLERVKPGLRLAVQNTPPPPDSEEDYGAQPPPAPIGVETAPEGEPSNLVELPVISAASFPDIAPPERRWIVKDIHPHPTVTIVAGDGGGGKTTLMLQLGVAIAGVRPWLGHDPDPGRVLLVTAEDDEEEIHRRAYAIAKGLDVELSELADLHIVPLAGRDAVMSASRARRPSSPQLPSSAGSSP